MSRLVTVIPVYNGDRFLQATLESVAAQTRRSDQVIIQDNCSTDGTAEYRAEVTRATREITGGLAWALGNLAVALRDGFGQGRR